MATDPGADREPDGGLFVSQLDRQVYKIKWEVQQFLQESGLRLEGIPGATAYVMRQLNKISLGPWYSRVKLDGGTKREIAAAVVGFAIASFASPEVAAAWSPVAIVGMIEWVYTTGTHRKKSIRM